MKEKNQKKVNINSNKLGNQNIKKKLKESLEKKIQDYTESIDLEKNNNLRVKMNKGKKIR